MKLARKRHEKPTWVGSATGLTLLLSLGSNCSAPGSPPENDEPDPSCAEATCDDPTPCIGLGCVDTDPDPTDPNLNEDPVLSGMSDITLSPPGAAFEGTLSVNLSSTRSDAQVRYTLDGSAPTAASMLWDGNPIGLSTTTSLRARVFVDGAPLGEEATGIYIARDFDAQHDLPVLLLDAYGAGAPDREYVDVALMTFEESSNSLSNTPTLASRAAFHLRGQSTASFEKPPYRIEVRDEEDDDRDLPLLGMPEESDWALRGPFADKALIRDAFFYGLGAEMGIASPRFEFCEVYRNVDSAPLAEDDYLGVYLLVETIKNAKNRLDLAQLEEKDNAPEQLSGAYIFKFEWLAAEEPILECAGENCWNDLEVYDPLPLAPAQRTWLGAHLRDFVDVLYSPGFADPTSGYQAYIDADSFVDQIIINELGREMDSYIRSAYFHKDRDGKIFAGPIWDYNLSLDTGGFFENREIEGWQYEQEREPIANDWMNRLLEDPAFVTRLSSRWQTLRADLLSDTALLARIDSLATTVQNAAGRNFARWPNLTEPMVGPFHTPTAATWEGQVDVIRTWVVQRAAWLDTQW